ncbi:hypothetical protein KY343_04220 [Candidatus Woesearchaeota archaeon]|nr:hypothetical protein [Candidatus Woesearchaeota archaeon]
MVTHELFYIETEKARSSQNYQGPEDLATRAMGVMQAGVHLIDEGNDRGHENYKAMAYDRWKDNPTVKEFLSSNPDAKFAEDIVIASVNFSLQRPLYSNDFGTLDTLMQGIGMARLKNKSA